jgi:hypothetical protein
LTVTWLLPSVRQQDGHGHKFLGVAARVPEHHALVPGALAVERVSVLGIQAAFEGGPHALGDVGRLFMDGGDHAAGRSVEAVLGPRIADTLDGLADQRGHIHVRLGGDFTGDNHQTGGDQGLTCHPTQRIVP